jgi:sec-independent protein translocase protein TatC
VSKVEDILEAESEAGESDGALDEVEAYRMSLIEHLHELKWRIIYALIFLLVGMGVSLVFARQIFAWLTIPFLVALEEVGVEGGLSLVHSPFEGVYTYLRVSFFGGVVFALPAIFYQLWAFVAPGLYSGERRVLLPLVFSSTALFLVGSLFAYYVIFPAAFPFFLQVIDAQANLSLEGYLSGVVRMMLAFGLCFQLPVVTWFLARIGLIDHRDMIEGFRYAIVGIFILSALITPPEVLTQMLLALPMCILYGVGIGVARIASTKKREPEEETPTSVT